MQAELRRAGRRVAAALAAMLGSAALALAHVPPIASQAAKSSDKTPADPTPLAVTVPRLNRAGLAWPRRLTPLRHTADDAGEKREAPVLSLEELQRVNSGQASPAEVAAAKIKADEAAVPARRAAIRYLASVQCHYHPEAEAALVGALRSDRNELVRIDAAQALAECCCCTPKTIAALWLVVSGSERDGNPAEQSERVKMVAKQALQRYPARGMTNSHPDTLPPATQIAPPKELQLSSFTTLPLPVRTSTPDITDAERRFAETAGLSAPTSSPPAKLPAGTPVNALRRLAETISGSAFPFSRPQVQSTSTLPEIRLQPIGVIPPPSRND